MHIFCEDALWDLWEREGSFRKAFVVWCETIIEGLAPHEATLDAKRVVGPLEPMDPAIRADIREIHGGGISIRDVARLYSLTLRDVVAALYGNQGRRWASYVVLEDELLAGRDSTNTWAEFNVKHGFSASGRVAQRLAEKHNIEVKQLYRGGRRRAAA